MKILLTNIGRRTYFIDFLLEINEEYNVQIYLTDTSQHTAGFWVSDKVIRIITTRVSGNEDLYLEELLTICKENKIDIIIPLMDFEIPLLAKNKDLFLEIGTTIIISDYNLVNALLDKKETAILCNRSGLNYPKIYRSRDEMNFPLIKKMRLGSGSVGLEVINSSVALNTKNQAFIFQEFIKGDEYNVDVFNSLNGEYVTHVVKKKIEMRAGETDKAEIVDGVFFEKFAKKISNSFKHIGNMDIDFIIDSSNKIWFIDFNPRFGGGYPFTHTAGCNFIKYIVNDYLKKDKIYIEEPNLGVFMKGIEVFKMKH